MKGLNLPLIQGISGKIEDFRSNSFGIISDDFIRLKPKFVKNPGDKIIPGDILFYDSTNRGTKFVSFVHGEVSEIVRGEKRKFLGYCFKGEPEIYKFNKDLSSIKLTKDNRNEIIDAIIDAGLWVSFRQRPFDKIANPDIIPDKIFAICLDSRPYSADVKMVIRDNEEYLKEGLKVLVSLSKSEIYLIKKSDTSLTIDIENIKIFNVDGYHPIGLIGTHINRLYPLNRKRKIWYIDLQDIICIGKLFKENVVDNRKVCSLAGESIQPKLYRMFDYSSISPLIKVENDKRIIAGSPLYGRKIEKNLNYINRYINIISIIKEAHDRRFIGWLMPGKHRFSVKNVFLSKLLKTNIFFDTSLNGSFRPMIPVGSYEKVSLLDTPITQFLRSLLVGDLEMAEKLGILDFGEEDMSVFTFVCVGKYDYSIYLRKLLDEIEGEM